jgi:hypothetical protein
MSVLAVAERLDFLVDTVPQPEFVHNGPPNAGDWRVVEASNKQEVRQVKRRIGVLSLALLAFGLTTFGQSQSTTTPNEATNQSTSQKQGRGAGGDIGSGSGDIGKGAGKGAGNLAKGTGKGAVDLATLHPVDAAGAIGKGGASAGKNVAVGTAKGTGKILKGTGKLLNKPF